MKLHLPPKPSAPPVVRLTLPGKPPLHVMRAQGFVQAARACNHRAIYARKQNYSIMEHEYCASRDRCMAAARAALAQGKG